MSDAQPDATWSYQPGDWFGIFGAELTLLLPGTERTRVTGLWELVDDGAGFGQVLDALLSSGLSSLSGFVLIGSGAGPTRIILRGEAVRAAVDTADGPVALEGSRTATWAERSFEAVASITVAVGNPVTESRHLPIEQGLVRVSRVDRPGHSSLPTAAAPDAHPELVPHIPEAQVEAQPSPPQSSYAAELGETTEPFTVSTPTPSPGQLLSSEPPQSPSVVSSVAKLLVSTGETVDVDRVVLFGRAPESRRFTSTEQPRLVTVASPLHEISSTHVEVRPGAGADHGAAVVTDMGSTNGTVLVQPGSGPEELKPGIAVRLVPGTVINLGDGVTIEVAQP